VDIETEALDALEFSEELEDRGLIDAVPEALGILQSRTFDRDEDDPFAKRYGEPQDPHHQKALAEDTQSDDENDR
jgi:hypothetical protein